MNRIALNILSAGFIFLIFACAEQPKEKEVTKDLLSPAIAEMLTNPMEYEGQHVSFEGIIGHVCRHSGDKMRVLQKDDSDYSILVMLGKYTGKFDTGFEGMHISANGILKIEKRDLPEAEQEKHEPDHEDECEKEHEHEHEPGTHHCETTQEAIRKMKELGIDPKIRPFIELHSFEIE